MPRQRFLCPRCGFVGEVFYPAPEYSPDHRRLTPYPMCPECENRRARASGVDVAYPGELIPYPDRMQHDLLTGGTGLVVENERGQDVTVSSLSEIRRIENESLRRARNKDGSPLVFRGFSQNRSNMQKNSLAGTEFEINKPVPFERKTRSGLPLTGTAIPESQAPKP